MLVSLIKLYIDRIQKSRFTPKLPLPVHICKSSYDDGSGIFYAYAVGCLFRFQKAVLFVIYYRCVTLADGYEPDRRRWRRQGRVQCAP